MAERIRIMLVEDHQVVRQGLVALLSAMDDLEVVGSVMAWMPWSYSVGCNRTSP